MVVRTSKAYAETASGLFVSGCGLDALNVTELNTAATASASRMYILCLLRLLLIDTYIIILLYRLPIFGITRVAPFYTNEMLFFFLFYF